VPLASGVAGALSECRTDRTSPLAISLACHGALRAVHAAMAEFASLERCAAYVAARATRSAVQRAIARWPESLADRTRRAAACAMETTAQALTHDRLSVGRRRCLRDAITAAVEVAAFVDLARAMGFANGDLDELQRLAGRSIALLAMFLHATTSPIPDGA
jgi:hypothetical protein